jgi:3-deoxy-D-manno-octulosonate 8-phosphate phosphatase (KDO 8-P phosphatase)
MTSADAKARARAVRIMIFDVDGVMTDGRLYFSNSGEEMKSFHTLDGQGVKMLRESGVEVALLTARQSQIVARRASELGITRVVQGASDKRAGFDELLRECGIEAARAGYAGDDLVDLPVMLRCGFAASVPEAPEVVRAKAHYVTRTGGGHGAVRELCEFIMQSQGTLESAIARYMHP